MDIQNKVWIEKHPFDTTKKVEVYRNLHADLWSVRQDNLVVLHTNRILLKDVKFYVQPAGNAKVRRTGRKNVHAYVKGFLADRNELEEIHSALDHDDNAVFEYSVITYNPKLHREFIYRDSHEPIDHADFLDMDIHDLDKLIAIWVPETVEEWL